MLTVIFYWALGRGEKLTANFPLLPCSVIITNYELRITNYELRITNYELRITNYVSEAVASHRASLRITNYELRITNYLNQLW
jgi:hypothetical protein